MTRQEELEAMSDSSLCKILANYLCIQWHVAPTHELQENGDEWIYSEPYNWNTGVRLPNYCNNPSEIMPLVLENNINLLNQYWCDGDGVNKLAMDFTHEIESKHKNVYRAACIVLILMKE